MKTIISVTGLGYVGLPLALEFAKHYPVIGFDINEARIALMKQSIDPSNELDSSAFEGKNITFTTEAADLQKANFHIIGVPTDIDSNKIVTTIERHANCSAASIPLALSELKSLKGIKPGKIVVFTAFGAGATWGAAIVRW